MGTDEGIIGREHPSAVVRADIARLVDSHGGQEGSCGLIAEDPEGEATPLHSKGVHMVEQDRVVRFQVSGAGGYGPPRGLDTEAVRADVLDGFVSVEAAERDYGVAIAADGSVDVAATAALRG